MKTEVCYSLLLLVCLFVCFCILTEFEARRFHEYQKRLESKNSAYLLDKNSTKFYEELRQRDLDEERKIKLQEAIELQRFKQLRERKKALSKQTKNISLGSISKPAILPRKNLQKTRENTLERRLLEQSSTKDDKEKDNSDSGKNGILTGYESSEDED